MTTQFANSVHDFQIAYERQGAGPALLLVHGFNNERTMWQEYGWIAQLQDEFTVITIDLRGCGESTASHQPDHYTLAAHLADVEAVLDACGVDRFCYWGWSFGATIGTHLAAQSDRLQQAVIAGTYFGPIFNTWHDDNLEIAHIAKVKREGRLTELELAEGKRQFAEAMDLDLFWARRYGAQISRPSNRLICAAQRWFTLVSTTGVSSKYCENSKPQLKLPGSGYTFLMASTTCNW